MPETPLVSLDSIDTYHQLYGIETLHPLVSVVDFNQVTQGPKRIKLRYGFYALWLKHGIECSLRYGRNDYDYQDGTVVSFAPGQMVEVEVTTPTVANNSVGLLFHPDLIHGTALGRAITDYHFFDYDSTEALHLSQREQTLIRRTFEDIRSELELPIDAHSQTILVDRIKLFLDYCQRFYDRQFITRRKVNSDILSKFEHELHAYFDSEAPRREGLPTVAYFAEKACLSSNYFGDLIKRETGHTPLQYIQLYVVERSKSLILDASLSIAQVSDQLGFQHPQHFTRFFKRHVGMSPSEYRC